MVATAIKWLSSMPRNLIDISELIVSFSCLLHVVRDERNCNKALERGMIRDRETYFSDNISCVTVSNGCKADTVSLMSEFLSVEMTRLFLSSKQRAVLIALCYLLYHCSI